jgi:antirestriction protein ArdC
MGAVYNRKALYKQITLEVVEMLKKGKIAWREQWVRLQSNFSTKQPYSGFNQFWLNLKMNVYGYKYPYWLGFMQAKKMGGKVKKGEKGTQVLFYSPYLPNNAERMCSNCKNVNNCSYKDTIADKKIKIESRDDIDNLCDDYSPVFKSILKTHFVFNLDQIEGIEIPEITEEYFYDISKVRNILDSYVDAPPVVEGGSKAAYNFREDFIKMPKKSLFFSEEGYWATLFHELTHSTGYEKRLNRKMTTQADLESYSFEELIAELGAMFLCAEAGIKNQQRLENSAAYIQSWITVLEDNPDWIFKASLQAQRAVNYILKNANQQEKAA